MPVASPREEKMRHRCAFLSSCLEQFTQIKNRRGKVVYCDPDVPHDLTESYYTFLPDIKAELETDGSEDVDHPVDRHKVAAATVYLILEMQPFRDAYQLQRSNTYEPGEAPTHLNSQFAIYTAIAVLDLWRTLSGQGKLIVTEKAKRFIREHVKLMTKNRQYPIFMAAQAFYLLEQLCLAEERLTANSIALVE